MIELPKKIESAIRVNAKNMVLFGLPKCGKTTALSQLPNCLIIDTEEGSEFINGLKIQIPKDKGPVGKFKWLKEVAAQIREENYPYDYVAIDTLTQLDEFAEWVGTFRYMNSTQGKKFNIYTKEDHPNDSDKWGEKLPFGHPDYESVHTIGEGYGYRWSRTEMTELYEALEGLGKICTFFVCHVADKAIVSKLNNQQVVTKDLSLTGKVRDIIARKVDALGYVFNKEGEINISFKGNEDKIGGIRSEHIRGYEGPLDWSKIFILNK